MILALRTDKPDAEIGLYDGTKRLAYEKWQAHRQLAETLHLKIVDVLQKHEKDLPDITGIIVFAGPGSFTGLRIGVSVANALSYSLKIPVVGSTTDDWVALGKKLLKIASKQDKTSVIPLYGTDAYITAPKK